jgi:hypothetical protein
MLVMERPDKDVTKMVTKVALANLPALCNQVRGIIIPQR